MKTIRRKLVLSTRAQGTLKYLVSGMNKAFDIFMTNLKQRSNKLKWLVMLILPKKLISSIKHINTKYKILNTKYYKALIKFLPTKKLVALMTLISLLIQMMLPAILPLLDNWSRSLVAGYDSIKESNSQDYRFEATNQDLQAFFGDKNLPKTHRFAINKQASKFDLRLVDSLSACPPNPANCTEVSNSDSLTKAPVIDFDALEKSTGQTELIRNLKAEIESLQQESASLIPEDDVIRQASLLQKPGEVDKVEFFRSIQNIDTQIDYQIIQKGVKQRIHLLKNSASKYQFLLTLDDFQVIKNDTNYTLVNKEQTVVIQISKPITSNEAAKQYLNISQDPRGVILEIGVDPDFVKNLPNLQEVVLDTNFIIGGMSKTLEKVSNLIDNAPKNSSRPLPVMSLTKSPFLYEHTNTNFKVGFGTKDQSKQATSRTQTTFIDPVSGAAIKMQLLNEKSQVLGLKKSVKLTDSNQLQEEAAILAGASINFEAQDQKESAALAESLTAEEVKDGVDIEYKIFPHGLKENLVLKKAPESTASAQFEFALQTSGVEPKKDDQGIWRFYESGHPELDSGSIKIDPDSNQDEKAAPFHIPAPYAEDAGGIKTDQVNLDIKSWDGCSKVMGGTEDCYKISLSVDPGWLSSASYPVLVDPSIADNTSTEFALGTLNRNAYPSIFPDNYTNYSYRKAVTITNGGSALHDFELRVQVDTASLITATKIQSDCDDIRFTDSYGNALDFYLETYAKATNVSNICNESDTDFWVEIPYIPSGTSTIYMYYGYASATSGSSGANTFTFFDDMESTSGWTQINNGCSETIVDGSGYLEVTCNDNAAAWRTNTYRKALSATLSTGEYRFWYRGSSQTYGTAFCDDVTVAAYGTNYYSNQFRSTTYCNGSALNSVSMGGTTTAQDAVVVQAISGTTYDVMDARNLNLTDGTADVYKNGTAWKTGVDGASAATFTHMELQVQAFTTSGTVTLRMDEMRLSRWADTEPTMSFGTEETPSVTISPNLETYYQELPADINTVGLWHMNENAANSCSGGSNDVCNNAGTGTAYDLAFTGNAAHTTTARLSTSALTFDGSGDYASCADATCGGTDKLDVGSKQWSVSAWIKTTQTAQATIISKGTTADFSWDMSINNRAANKATFEMRQAGGSSYLYAASTTSINDGNWHHVTGTWDPGNTNIKIYVDGVLEATTTTTSGIHNTNSAATFRIGSLGNDADYYNGSVDEVGIWSRVLTPDEIRMMALRRPYSTYTSAVFDLTANMNSFNSLSWSENAVKTTGGETLFSDTSLVAQWNFNDTPSTATAAKNAGSCSTTTCDLALGNFDNTASYDGDPDSSWTSANRRWGAGGIQFDGTDSDATCTDANCGGTSKLDYAGSGSWTIETWVKPSVFEDNDGLVVKDNPTGSQRGYHFGIMSSGVFRYLVSSDGSTVAYRDTPTVGPPGEWYHVVGVFTPSTNLDIYVNGVKKNGTLTGTIPSTIFNNTTDFSIGAHQGGTSGFFRGVMDSTRIYNRALTPYEIISNYNHTNLELQTRTGNSSTPNDGTWEDWKPNTNESELGTEGDMDNPYQYNTSDSGLVSYWPMDETSGSVVNDIVTTNEGATMHGQAATGGTITTSGGYTIHTFTSSGVFNANQALDVEYLVVAGGGGGGGKKFNEGGAGGGGAGGMKTGSTSVAAQAYTITVGAGGAGGIYGGVGSGVSGSNGENSSFGSLVTATGGGGGDGPTSTENGKDGGSGGGGAFISGTGGNGTGGEGNNGGTQSAGTGGAGGGGAGAVGSNTVAGHNGAAGGNGTASSISGASVTYAGGGGGAGYNGGGEGGTGASGGTGGGGAGGQTDANGPNGTNGTANTGGGGGGGGPNGGNGGSGIVIVRYPTVGASSIVDGKFSKARGFDGTDDYIQVAHSASLNLSNLTIEAWVQSKDFNAEGGIIFEKTIGGTQATQYSFFFSATNTLVFKTVSGGSANNLTYTGTSALGNGTWHHVVATYDGSTKKIYIDGQLATSASYSSTLDTGTGISRIGGLGSNFMNGAIDELRIYSSALSAATVQQHFLEGASQISGNNIANFSDITLAGNLGIGTTSQKTILGAPKVDSKTVGLWHFDESIGVGSTGIMYDSVGYRTFAKDSTGNLEADLISFWELEEASDNTCPSGPSGGTDDSCDSVSKNGLDISGSPDVVAGKLGNARDFDGSSDYLSRLDPPMLDFSDSADMTICGWFNRDTFTTDDTIVSKKAAQGTSAGYVVYVDDSDDKVYLDIGDGTDEYTLASTSTFTATGWNHFCAVWDQDSAANSEIYINGADDNASDTGTIGNIGDISTNATFRFGQSDDGTPKPFDGKLDEIGIWGRALSSTEISDLYNSGNANVLTSVASNNGASGGTITIADGFYGKGKTFGSGLTSNINMGDQAALEGTSEITIEAWIKTTSTNTYNMIASKKTSATNGWYLATKSTGYMECYFLGVSTSAQVIGATRLVNDGKWHHVACTRNSSGVTLYVDGNSENSSANNTGDPASTANFKIGNWDDGSTDYYFNGTLDEVRVSSVVRTYEEIQESYRAGRDHRIGKNLTSTTDDISASTSVPFYIAADRPGTYLEATIGESAFVNGEPDENTKFLVRMEEGAGTGAYIKDSSGNGNNGTPNGTTFVQGKFGKGRKFNGSSDYVQISDAASVDLKSQSSFSMWINITALPGTAADILTKWTSGSGNAEYIWQLSSGGVLTFNTYQTGAGSDHGACGTGSPALAINTWYHVAAVLDDGTNLKCYINGVLVHTQTSFTGTLNTAGGANVRIGARGDGAEYFNGIIDEVRFDNAVKTADQIRQLYEVGKRTHPITIDFASSLQSAYTSGTSMLVKVMSGQDNLSDSLKVGDTIIVQENVGGVEYRSTGVVSSIANTSTRNYGTVTLASALSSSTMPAGGYSISAKVFKWQREYFDLSGIIHETSGTTISHKDAITRLTIRVTDGSQGANVWLDDFKNASYLTDASGSNVASGAKRYYQYRVIQSAADPAVSSNFTSITQDYRIGPKNEQILRHGFWFNNGTPQPFWW